MFRQKHSELLISAEVTSKHKLLTSAESQPIATTNKCRVAAEFYSKSILHLMAHMHNGIPIK